MLCLWEVRNAWLEPHLTLKCDSTELSCKTIVFSKVLLKWHPRGNINFSVGPVRFNSVDLSLSGWFSTCIPGRWGLERWVLSDRIHLGRDPLLSHSRIMALQVTWLQGCNTDKSESSIIPVRSDQPECENSCGDGGKYGILHSEGAHFPFGLVNGEAFFLHTF